MSPLFLPLYGISTDPSSPSSTCAATASKPHRVDPSPTLTRSLTPRSALVRFEVSLPSLLVISPDGLAHPSTVSCS